MIQPVVDLAHHGAVLHGVVVLGLNELHQGVVFFRGTVDQQFGQLSAGGTEVNKLFPGQVGDLIFQFVVDLPETVEQVGQVVVSIWIWLLCKQNGNYT